MPQPLSFVTNCRGTIVFAFVFPVMVMFVDGMAIAARSERVDT